MNFYEMYDSVPEAPCERGCPHIVKCRDRHMACGLFARYVGLKIKPRRDPSKAIYRYVFTD